MPIALISNWNSINENQKSLLIIILLLEIMLLTVFLVLNIFLFYIFFESILPPLFLLVGLFGSSNKVRASFYLFLYTLWNPKCKIAKHRGSPKAIVTEEIKETLFLAWLMAQGMVKSLTTTLQLIIVIIDKWAITALNHSCVKIEFKQKYKGVKEQRVDGYLNSRNLDFIRCTLVAGKPVFERKIHFYVNNSIITHNIFKHYLHRTRSVLDPWFITGFVEAEGCFIIGFFLNNSYRTDYQVQAIFKITLHNKDYNLLCQIKDYFGFRSATLILQNMEILLYSIL